jgi:hypothetical protein
MAHPAILLIRRTTKVMKKSLHHEGHEESLHHEDMKKSSYKEGREGALTGKACDLSSWWMLFFMSKWRHSGSISDYRRADERRVTDGRHARMKRARGHALERSTVPFSRFGVNTAHDRLHAESSSSCLHGERSSFMPSW